MGQILYIKGETGSLRVDHPEDAVDTIERLCGDELGNYMREFFSRDLEEIEMDKRLNSDITSYESSLDSNRSAFQDIICEMDALKLELNKKRLDRSSLRKIMESTMRIIENQI